LKKIEIDKAN